MLVAVKQGWMQKIDEKRWNSRIMVWLRAPGCVYHALFCWLAIVDITKREAAGEVMLLPHSPLPQTPFHINLCLWVVCITFFWNGLFFMERVVANHAATVTKAKALAGGGAGGAKKAK